MRRALVFALVFALAGVSAAAAGAALRLVGVASGFANPVHVAATASEPGRLYVVEQRGVVKVIRRGRVRATPFLDIRDLVSCCGEQGLLSVAFHPRYGANRRLFVYYTNRAGDIRIVEYRANRGRTRVVERTRRVRVAIDHPPATNHNGGQLAFGPDGGLYTGTGDGGGGCDPGNNAQSLGTRLGKLLRLNVDAPRARPAIVAYGLRNPWRFSFDRANGNLYIGDVGQNTWEEIHFTPHGRAGLENYGWDVYEGPAFNTCGNRSVNGAGSLVAPIHWYGRGLGCAVTGGFVYRGRGLPSARGRYFFGDYCSGRVWSFVVRNGARRDLRAHARLSVRGNLSSFGEGPRGALYLVSHNGGRIFRLGST